MRIPHERTGEFDYADYELWPDDERWELLDGHAVAMAPPSTNHQRAVFELGRQIGNQLAGHPCQAFAAPMGVRLPRTGEANDRARTVFEPDLLVVCDPTEVDAKGILGAPDFIIEVLSPSTASFDQIEKRLRYEDAGVRELWLIDTNSGVLTVYRFGRSGFLAPEIRRCDARFRVQAIDGLELDLEFIQALIERGD